MQSDCNPVQFIAMAMREVLGLLRYCFLEEDKEATVPVRQLPARLRLGMDQCNTGVWSKDSALAAMLRDEKTTMGLRASSARLPNDSPMEGSERLIQNPLLRRNQRLTGELPLEEDSTVQAFTWVFAVKSALSTMEMEFVSCQTGRTSGFGPGQDTLPAGIALSLGMMDVNLGAIARSSLGYGGYVTFHVPQERG